MDVTEIKKAEEALRTSEQKFRDLIEATTDWIWEVDEDGAYTYVSPKVKDLLGYGVSEVMGKTPFDLMPKEEAETIGRLFKEKLIKKQPFYRLENINRHKALSQNCFYVQIVPINLYLAFLPIRAHSNYPPIQQKY